MSAALKKINARVKQLQKKHPKSKRVTLQKQAGREYKAGKLKTHRKKAKPAPKRRARKASGVGSKYKVYHEVKKVGKARKKRTARRSKPKVRTVTRVRTRTVYKRRASVGRSGMSSIMPVVAIAGLGLIAYMLLKPKTQVTVPGVSTPLVLTGNPTRDNSAQNVLAYAQAAGIGLSAITALINSLNSMSDSAVVDVAQQAQSGTSINTLLALPTGGPSINLG